MHPTFATIAFHLKIMTRLVAIAALAAGALYLLDSSGTVQISGGSASTGTFSGYTSSSAPALSGIKKAAGG